MKKNYLLSFQNIIYKIYSTEKIYKFCCDYLGPSFNEVRDNYEYEKNSSLISIVVKERDELSTQFEMSFNKNKGKLFDIHYDQKAEYFKVNNGLILVKYHVSNHILLISNERIEIYLDENEKEYIYIPMRIIREISVLCLIKNGYMPVHASSFISKETGKVSLVVGD